jgi:hypothetical protein
MSFWSFWSRRAPRPASAPASGVSAQPQERPAFSDADREFISNALDRFETNGLRIWSKLNRDLIIARALIDIDRWKQDIRSAENDLLPLFLALASETDGLTYYIDDVEELFPSLSSMDEDAAEAMLGEHSLSIFANAGSITTVHEDNSLVNMVHALAALCELDVSEADYNLMKNGQTRVTFQVEGSGECHFDIGSEKRPDITPALAEMNRIAGAKNLGRYIIAPEGNSDSETFIFATEAVIPKITNLLKLS